MLTTPTTNQPSVSCVDKTFENLYHDTNPSMVLSNLLAGAFLEAGTDPKCFSQCKSKGFSQCQP